jgi:hypothetical protein
MTTSSARTAANVLMGLAGAAAAYVFLTKPPLRRLLVRSVRIWLGASVPAYLLSQVGRAWVESKRAA